MKTPDNPKRARSIPLLLVFLSLVAISCSKEPGEGGSSCLSGKILVREYDETFTTLLEEYYGQEVDVYIIYGDEISFGDRTRTSYDGTYQFRYLRKGSYRVFAYSKDSTCQTNAMIPVIREVSITKNYQQTELPEIIILK